MSRIEGGESNAEGQSARIDCSKLNDLGPSLRLVIGSS
jgi:hypothetical protein